MKIQDSSGDQPYYSWQYLVGKPYGTAIWDTAILNGVPGVLFMARESAAVVQRIPARHEALWKGKLLGLEVTAHPSNKKTRVMLVAVMVNFFCLQTIYEFWFNFYGAFGAETQLAFKSLGMQENLYLFFFDRGPMPERQIAFLNGMKAFFHGAYGMISAMPPWTDAEFNEAKRHAEADFPPQVMWEMK